MIPIEEQLWNSGLNRFQGRQDKKVGERQDKLEPRCKMAKKKLLPGRMRVRLRLGPIMTSSGFSMAASIKDFYPKLAHVPEIVEIVEHYFGENAHSTLDAMKLDQDLGDVADEVEGLITEFVADHATEVAVFKGLGQGENSSKEAMDYLEKHHPEAHDLMLARTEELQKLLGKDGAAAALGQSREPFAIRIFQYKFLYVVTAEEFEDEFFDDEGEAVEFAQSNYASFIENYKQNQRPNSTGK